MDKSNSHIKGLDGLRAIAATLVFGYHLWGHWNWAPVQFSLLGQQVDLTWLLHYGTEGVSIFFVLSGFLLSQPFWKAAVGQGKPVNVRSFFKRRFWRIYPAYLVALVIFFFFYDVQDALGLRLTYFVTHLFLIHNLFELTVFRSASPLWSVATEFQMYLFMPLLFSIIGWYLHDKGRPGIAAAVFFVAAGLFAVAFYQGSQIWFAAHPIDPNIIRSDGEVIPHLPFVGMAYFASGIAFGYVYQWVQNKRRAGLPWHPVAPELIAIGFIVLLIPFAMASPNLAGVTILTWPRLALFYGVIVAAVALGGQTRGLTSFLEWGPIRWLGMISYSFYLYHDLALHLSFHYLPNLTLGPVSDGTVKGVIAFGVTVVVSALSYYLIETRFHAPRPATATSLPEQVVAQESTRPVAVRHETEIS